MDVKRVAALSDAEERALFERDAGVAEIRDDVRDIVAAVRADGDDALRVFSREFDGAEVEEFEVSDRAARAYDEVPGDVRDAIETAVANVREFHEAQMPADWREEFSPGRELGRRFRPVERVGVYAPGGTAAYPSSAIMGVVPAKVAGVPAVAVATPPADELNPVTLAAVHAAGADEVYQVGGAQAVAALAYGTESVPAVEKIVGPGSRWVTAAKAEVRGDAAIDFLAGPSEFLAVADGTADPRLLAADVVAQAEHDPHATAVVVTTDADLAAAVVEEVERQLSGRERESVARDALAGDASGVFVADTMAEACAFAESYAPEHLAVQAADDEAVLDGIDSAGSAFLGPYTPVAAGDYASGTNHVLPTNGLARVTGGLSVDTFLRATTVQRLDRDALGELRDAITTLAEAEGLDGHEASVDARFEEE